MIGYTVILFLVLCCSVEVSSEAISIYVSPGGSDYLSGLDPSHPLKTLHKARDRIDDPDIKGSEVIVELMQGYYDLQSTLYFNHTYTAPVTFRSYQHQEVHVTGGTRINPSLFQPVTDPAILSVIPPVAHSKVRQIHLPDAGITDYGVMSVFGLHASRIAPLEVFINGSPLRIARWPNEFYINIVGVPDGQFGLRFQHNSTRDSHWMNEKDPWVYGFWYWSWADASAEVAKIDPSNHMITLTNKTYYGLRTGHLQTDNRDIGYDKQGGYFRVLNMLSELDQPGEYYIDRSTGFLYLWPNTPTGTLQSSDVIYASILENCITLQDGVSNINFEDFTIENCRAFGLSATSSHNVTFRNLEVKNAGWVGISCRGDCRNVTVSKCDVHDCDGGVSIEGGDRPNLIPSGNLVEDNHIWRVGRVSVTGAMGLSHGGVHNIIRYNHIHNTTYACIFWGGNDHIMEYNYFQDCNQNASDGGAVHCDRDWTMRGNIIRYNYFHNTLRYWPGAQVRGIMLDDEFSSVAIENNVFSSNEVHANIGGGRDNIIRYNILYNATGVGLDVDGRGLQAKFLDQLEANLNRMPYTDALWSSRYPLLAAMAKNNKTHGAPEGNQIYSNIYYTANTTGFLNYHGAINLTQYFNVYNNKQALRKSDFADPDDNNFQLQGDIKSWADRNQFEEPVPFNKVGPRSKPGPSYLQK